MITQVCNDAQNSRQYVCTYVQYVTCINGEACNEIFASGAQAISLADISCENEHAERECLPSLLGELTSQEHPSQQNQPTSVRFGIFFETESQVHPVASLG